MGKSTLETTEIKTLIAVNNPTYLSRWLKKIEFDLYINDLKIASELFKTSIEIKPLSKTEISLTSFLNNGIIFNLWATYVKDDQFNVELIGNATFALATREAIFPIGYKTSTHTPLLELLSTKQLTNIRVGPTTLVLKYLNLTWGEATPTQTKINIEASIYNPNIYSATLRKIYYAIEMNHIEMGKGSIYNSIALEANQDKKVLFTAILDNKMLIEWWVSHVRNDEITSIVVKFQGVVDISGAEYNFQVESSAEASVRILGATISLAYYVPII